MKKLISFQQLKLNRKHIDYITKKPRCNQHSYLVLCHLCTHNTQDDQICDHAGQDKRGLKSCD